MNQVQTAAAFLGIEPGELDSIASNVVDRIAAKAWDHERAGQVLEETVAPLDQEISRLRANERDLQTQLQASQQAEQDLNTSINQLKELASSRAEQIRDLEAAKMNQQRDIQALSEEKRNLVESFEQRLLENRQLRSEADAATRCSSEIRRANTELELSTVRLSAELASAQSNAQKHKITADRNQSTIEWLQDELKRLRTEYTEFRQSMLDQLQEKTAQLDTTEATYRGIRQSHEILKGYYNEKSLRLEESVSTLQRLRVELTSERTAFEAEMTAQKRVSAVLEETVEQCRNQISDLEAELDAERQAADKRVSALQAKVNTTRAETTGLQEKLHLAEEQLSEVYETSINGSLADADQSRLANISNGALSPSASILSELRRSGGSIVDLNASYQRARREATNWKRKYEHMRRDMDQILEELQANAPLLEAQQEEHAKLRQQFVEFSERYDDAVRKASEAAEEVKVFERKLKDSATERGLMTRQVADLSRQLQHVLINSQLGADGEPLMSAEEQRALAEVLDNADETAGEDTNRLISQRLVLFKDIAELQQQNTNLLRSCRALGQQMEQQEADAKRKYDNLETETVAQATVALETVQRKLEKVTAELELAQRDRDMFRDLTKTGEAGSLLAVQAELKAKLESAQSELVEFKAKAAQRLAEAEARATEAERVQRDLDVQLARAQAQVELVAERKKSAEEDLQLARSEHRQLADRAAALKDSESRHEQRAQLAQQEVLTLRAQLDTARSEVAGLRAEHKMWARTETELVAARETAQAEAAQLRAVLARAETRDGERDTASADAHRRLLQQIDQLQSTVAQLNRKLASAEDQLKLVSHRREKEFESHSARELELSNQMAQFREQLALAQLTKEPLELKISELTSKLSAAEKRAELRAAKHTASASQALSEREIAEKQVEEMVAVVQASEEALAELQAKYAALERVRADEVAAKEADCARISEELTAARQQIEQLQSQRSQIDEAKAAVAAKEAEVASLSAELSSAQTQVQQALQNQEAATRQAASEAERTLQLADVVSGLETRISELDGQLAQRTADLSEARNETQRRSAAWDNERTTLSERVRETQAKLDDMIPKYQDLQTKFDEMINQAQASLADAPQSDGASKLIEFLRERNDLAAQSLQVAQEEAQGLRSRLSRAEAELASAQFAAEQFKAQLDEVQTVQADSTVSTAELETANARALAAEEKAAEQMRACDEATVRATELRAQLRTVQEHLSSAQVQIDARVERIRQLETDNQRWVSEIQAAKTDAEHARSQLGTLRAEAQSKLDKNRQERAKLRDEAAALREALESKTAELEQLKAQPLASIVQDPVPPTSTEADVAALKEKEERIEFLENEINKVSDDLVEAQAETQKADERCQKLKAELDDVRTREQTKDREIEELKAAATAAPSTATPASESQNAAVTEMLSSEQPPSEELEKLRAILVEKAGEEPVSTYTTEVENATRTSLKQRTHQYIRNQREKLEADHAESLKAKLEEQRKEVEKFLESKAKIRQRLLEKRAESLEEKNNELSKIVRKLKGGVTDVAVETLPSGVTIAKPSPDAPQVNRPHVNRVNRSNKRGSQDQASGNNKKRKED